MTSTGRRTPHDPTGIVQGAPGDAPDRRRAVVAGLGSEHRRDDGIGPVVAALVAADARNRSLDVLSLKDPLDLLGVWDNADLAVVVDALRSGSSPGTLHLVELAAPPRGSGAHEETSRRTSSTHALGLHDVLRLSRALGRAPRRVVAVGVEGRDFGRGRGLSRPVAAAAQRAAAAVAELVEEVDPCA